MVILSDIENFSIRACCAILAIACLTLICLLVKKPKCEQDMPAAEPEQVIVRDTVTVRDTVYILNRKSAYSGANGEQAEIADTAQ